MQNAGKTISVIARNFGRPRFALCVAFIINILNVAGSYTALYKPFGLIYIQNIIPFVYLLSVSMGMATQIMVGHLVGAGKKEEANKESLKSLKYGIISNTVISLLILLLRIPILHLYTKDTEIIKIAAFILILDLGVEIGRAFNNILAWTLRGAGDARYTMKMAVISMGAIDIPLCYILGLWLHMGITGIWIAFALDEWYRGIMFYRCWKSRKWEDMCLVSSNKGVSVN